MEINEFKEIMLKYSMAHEVYFSLLDLISISCPNILDNHKKLLLMYFTFISDGNLCMTLDSTLLKDKWDKKIEEVKIINIDSNTIDLDCLKEDSYGAIDESLSTLKDLDHLYEKDGFFRIEDNWLYMKKYYYAKFGVEKSIKRLFKNNSSTTEFNYKDYLKSGSTFCLSRGQEKAIVEGLKHSLIITGGPGTGKTTSIVFLLIGLLKQDINRKIYLTAPSGKAAQRMKESILKNLLNVKDCEELEALKALNLDGKTIHGLLETNSEGIFKHNKNNQFEKAIFIIDEASMIDVEIFNSLLQAIRDGSLVYIMGDKNQLPSVDVGAVFSDLLDVLPEFVVELDESKRFEMGSSIYNLAEAINNGNDLNIDDSMWKSCDDFIVSTSDDKFPIYYYSDITSNDNLMMEKVISVWRDSFYNNLKDKFSNLDEGSNFNLLFKESENAKILCAENKGVRGVVEINRLIRKINNNKKNMNSYSPGEIVMISKNDKTLDLYNGDCGIITQFKDDDTLYLMVQKTANFISSDGKKTDKIFKLGEFVFYPIRLIPSDEIDLAYAITIHKSQGSDYKNILVILPKNINHPLVNRQIVYTAITRTKGSTYIVSNINTLDKAKNTKLQRDTNIRIEA